MPLLQLKDKYTQTIDLMVYSYNTVQTDAVRQQQQQQQHTVWTEETLSSSP